MKPSQITINSLQQMKQKGNKISMLTAYDASFAGILNQTEIEVLLVGDSLGSVIQGNKTTVPVTLVDMIYHTKAVARANQEKFLITDMPFMSYATTQQTLNNATLLMQAGAMMVKCEGGAWLTDTIKALVDRGIPVCAHLGLTPQAVHKLGGYKYRGKTSHEAENILEDAIQLEKAGAQLLVLECIPNTLAEEITGNLTIPVIGIGAGPYCDGQVLVLYDILGISSGGIPSFSRNFLAEAASIEEAIQAYVTAVKAGDFPPAN